MCRGSATSNSEQKETVISVKGDGNSAKHVDAEDADLSVYAVERYHLTRWPTLREVTEETKSLYRIAGPVAFTGLLFYSRAVVSMLFLGHLGELELAGGSLAIGFANITGYSVISGLAMGMEPICSQAFGAERWTVLGSTLQRTILFLLTASIPIAFMWLNMRKLLIWCGQEEQIAATAGIYILYSLPDLVIQSILQPLRIYLRTQNITKPLAVSAAAAVLLHLPINMLILRFQRGVAGVALAAAITNLNMLIFLIAYIVISGTYKQTWDWISVTNINREMMTLICLALPSCASVCLEWWWYEIMIILCGLLPKPRATISAMGILIQTTSLIYVFPSSLSMGVSTRVGNELGANRPEKARISTIVAVSWAFIVAILSMALAVSIRHFWASFFTADEDISSLTAAALPVLGLCELGNSPQTTGCGVLRGTARPRLAANINFGSFYLVGMPVAVLLAFLGGFGFVGLWLGMLSAQICCGVLMMFNLICTDWSFEAQKAFLLTHGGDEDDKQIQKALLASADDAESAV